MAIVAVSISPVGEGPSVGDHVAAALDVLHRQDRVRFELGPMFTTLEGDLREIFDLVLRMQEAVFARGAVRVSTVLKIDERRDRPVRMEEKVRRVEETLAARERGGGGDAGAGAAARPAGPTEIPCDGFRIRPYRPGDEEALVRQANNRRVWRNLTDRFPHPYTREVAAWWIARSAERPGERPRHLSIELDGELVGGIGYDPYDDLARRGAEVGYWLGEPFWGRGIATEALRRFTAWVFATTDLVRLQGTVLAWNPASARVLEKAGYTRDAVLPKSITKDGALIDSYLYGRVREDL